MRVSSIGLLRNAAAAIRALAEVGEVDGEHQSAYYAHCLEEFAEDIERVHKGKDSIGELAFCYCLAAEVTP